MKKGLKFEILMGLIIALAFIISNENNIIYSDPTENLAVNTSSSDINHPSDRQMEYGSYTWISWEVSEDFISIEILRDGRIVVKCQNTGYGVDVLVENLPVGTYTYTCLAYKGGISISDSVNVTVVDTRHPTIEGPWGVIYEEGTTGNTITWNARDRNPESFIIKRDDNVVFNGSWGGRDITINVDFLPVGEYWYTCIVYDKGGNSASDRVYVEVLDITPPNITVNLDGRLGFEGWYVSPVTLTISTIDPEPSSASGWASISIRGFPPDPDEYLNFGYSFSHTFLNDGTYEFWYHAGDAEQNLTPDECVTFKIDQTLPETSLALSGEVDPEGDYISPVTVTLTSTDAASGSGVKSTYYRINCGDWTEYYDTFTLVDEELYYISYYSLDNAGNIGLLECATFKIANLNTATGSNMKSSDSNTDTNVNFGKFMSPGITTLTITDYDPDIPAELELAGEYAINHPSDRQMEYGSYTWISWEVSEDFISIEILRDGRIVVKCQNIGYGVDVLVENLPVGTYTYTCLAYKGGITISDSVIVTVVDTRCPKIDNPWGVIFEEGTTGNTITWKARDLNPENCIIKMEDIVVFSGSWGGRSITINVDFLPVGKYWYTCTVYDKGGNSISDNVYVEVLDITPPNITVNLDGRLGFEGWYVSPVTLTISTIDPEPSCASGWASISIRGFPPDPDEYLNFGYSFSYTFLNDGTYEFWYHAGDAEQNLTPDECVTFKIDKTPPETSLALSGEVDPEGNYISPVTVTLTSTDAASGSGVKSTYYRINCEDWTEYYDSFTLVDEGVYYISYYSLDNAGNIGLLECVMFKIVILNTPTGSNIEVSDPNTDIEITFEEVTSAGMTMVSSSEIGPDPPIGSQLGSTYYSITTTADYLGRVYLAIPYDEDIIGDENFLTLMHYNEIGEWEDVTVGIDTVNNFIYGEIEILSIFALFIDVAPPSVNVETPQENEGVQDGIIFKGTANDFSGIKWVKISIRELGGDQGVVIDPIFEDIVATYNDIEGIWQLPFNTIELPDGNYLFIVKASDNFELIATVKRSFSIRNWVVFELLPKSKQNNPGRTMPVKFSLRVAELVDPNTPFVRNEELNIIIYTLDNPEVILQNSTFGDTSVDYRINSIDELYITNFKTLSNPKFYVVEIWIKGMLIDFFTFETDSKKKNEINYNYIGEINLEFIFTISSITKLIFHLVSLLSISIVILRIKIIKLK